MIKDKVIFQIAKPTKSKTWHTIRKGDTFSKLAQKYLGDWKRWKEIQDLNPHMHPLKLEIGASIIIQ